MAWWRILLNHNDPWPPVKWHGSRIDGSTARLLAPPLTGLADLLFGLPVAGGTISTFLIIWPHRHIR